MPRKKSITVAEWPPLDPAQTYELIVTDLTKGGDSLHATVRHIEGEQLGRVHQVELPLPPRPALEHPTTGFLHATLGTDPRPGVNIPWEEATGTRLRASFIKGDAETWLPIQFLPTRQPAAVRGEARLNKEQSHVDS